MKKKDTLINKAYLKLRRVLTKVDLFMRTNMVRKILLNLSVKNSRIMNSSSKRLAKSVEWWWLIILENMKIMMKKMKQSSMAIKKLVKYINVLLNTKILCSKTFLTQSQKMITMMSTNKLKIIKTEYRMLKSKIWRLRKRKHIWWSLFRK